MISEKCSFRDFVETVKDMDFLEMICLTDQEATYAERLAIKNYGPEDQKDSICGRYSTKLKSFILFLRHGVKPCNIKEHNLETIGFRYQRLSEFTAQAHFTSSGFTHRNLKRR